MDVYVGFSILTGILIAIGILLVSFALPSYSDHFLGYCPTGDIHEDCEICKKFLRQAHWMILGAVICFILAFLFYPSS